MANTFENPIRDKYLHADADLPKHVDDLRKIPENPQAPKPGNREQAVPMQRVVFDRRHIDLFNAALNNPNHQHRREAEKAMRGFARAVEKPQGISINAAAEEFNVPDSFLWRWTKQYRVIPMLLEGEGIGSATILDREKVQEVAELYHEAKRQRKQPKKLLEAKYPNISKVSKK